MRITGGTLLGRTLRSPAGLTTRPTSDRVREALFNILAHHNWGTKIAEPIDNAKVLDAFCGTGALAIEAISRGAIRAILFDKDKQALRHTKENISALNLEKLCSILPVDATRPPKPITSCNLVFLDPPYRKNLVAESIVALDKAGWLAPNVLIVAETAKDEAFQLPEKFAILLSRKYGDTAVSFISYQTTSLNPPA